MDRSDFDKYIEEMKAMSRKAVLTAENTLPVIANSQPSPSDVMSGKGFILVNVTTVQELYPVAGAKVTVFSGDIENMVKIAEDTTDQSGKTELFTLSAPPRNLAQDPDNKMPTFAVYNILTEADGFIPTINYNAAVFDGVTSIQNVNLIPQTAYNEGDSNIFDENNNYEL